MKISELKAGEQIKARWLVTNCDVRKTNTRPPRDFLQVTLTDGIDDIKGMLWNYVNVGNLPPIGKAANITAQVGEYNGNPQLTLTRIELADNQDMSDFLPDLGYDREVLFSAILNVIEHIADPTLQAITYGLYTENKEALLLAPAAKSVHHAGLGGLLKHSLEVLDLSLAIANCYNTMQLSASLLMAGALVHDIGKLKVYMYNDCLIDMSDEGYLMEHIPIGIAMLSKYDSNATHDKVLLLQHIVASHHGKLEFGSSVTPKFAEAYIINRADGISATLDILNLANKKARQNDRYTQKIYMLDNYPHMLQDVVAEIMLQ